MKNNRIRLTSYISPDLDELIEDYMAENNISTKSQAIERMLIEFKYMRNEINFLRNVVGGNSIASTPYSNALGGSRKSKQERDKVKDSIDDIFSNMPD
ncbi:hypothetical protein [Peptostreptococcus canis]|uniref:Ribbon-helix-helix protein, copG family n=1 Tax=Peptostreptococcus canis TaxID=1159213 RepID=A0ABR6TM33_9FIRM|nr:hypothetical protein [Peptostreptococcus canis]MBC2576454.1 hypothetical protein [Peptostreptococcus canis]MBP1998429.1 hypothetical protein [Peptostreptococcus canis]